MDKVESTKTQQIAEAASAFARRQTGHSPKSVTVMMSEETLVITLHGALSPAEEALAGSPKGAAQLQEFHRQLFTSSSESFREEIKRITGVAVREAAADIEADSGALVKVFTTGTLVHVFLLARGVSAECWSGNVAGADS
jgi:uncharacterized protein YbcI